MAIKNIKYKKNDNLEESEISFVESNIATVVGMNGSGKSVLMRHIKETFGDLEIKRIVHKKDLEIFERKLSENFLVGKSRKDVENYFSKISKDHLSDSVSFLKALDTFIWENFWNSYKAVLENNLAKDEYEGISKEYENVKKSQYFQSSHIIEISEKISNFVQFKTHDDASTKLSETWKSLFSNSKCIMVDVQQLPLFSGTIEVNGLGDYKLSRNILSNPLFSRLIRVMGAENRLDDIVKGADAILEEDLEKINSWISSYLSQNIKINFNISGNSYSIKFYETNIDEPIDFSVLSSGTKNLFAIMSQITSLNTETIVMIDEPENGMHPVMQIQFREFLEDLSSLTGARFIIFTHSKQIVKFGSNTRGLYIMTRKDGVSTLYDRKAYLEKENMVDIQIFDSIGFEGDTSDYNFSKANKIVIVEGDTDVIYLKKMASLLNVGGLKFMRTKLGGATSIDKTSILLSAVHDQNVKKIVLSPDLDIETKHPKTHKAIKDGSLGLYAPLGTTERQEVEGMFFGNDTRYVSNISGGKNTKSNKANQFWRTEMTVADLNDETAKAFKTYFDKISK